MSEITVVLNGFRRPDYLKTQLEAINNQTVKPESIMLWQNVGALFDRELTKNLIQIHTHGNRILRFYAAHLAIIFECVSIAKFQCMS